MNKSANPKTMARYTSLLAFLLGIAGVAPGTSVGLEAQEPAVNSAEMIAKEQSEHPTLAIGAPLPAFALKGVDGKIHTADEFKSSRVLAVMFTANHCPAAQGYEGREKALFEEFSTKGVAFVAIQSDNPAATQEAELNFTDVDDSYDSMVIRATYRKFPYPYLYDGDEQAAAEKFGPKATPHIFIFDKQRKLRYEGRIDDNLRESNAKTHEARDAIEALLAGRSVAVTHTPVFGCSTKWRSRIEGVKQEAKDWLREPVTLNSVTLQGLAALRRTPPGRMLMINFWATWCGPCQTEYPQLLSTFRWYRNRDFDFVSVSVDSPSNRAAVLRFLNRTHSAIGNLQVDTEDVYAVQKAFDPDWQSGVPFTIVIAPNGKVVYRQQGEADILKLRRSILANLSDEGALAGNAKYWSQ